MTTNITINTLESTCTIFLPDGSTLTVEPHSSYSGKLEDDGFATISDASPAESPISPEEGEHPDIPPMQSWVDKMIAYWQALREKLQEEMDKVPHAEPRK